MRIFVAADAITFATLIATALLARASGSWAAPGDPAAGRLLGVVLTALLIGASACIAFGKGRRWSRLAAAGLGLAFVLAAAYEWHSLGGAGLALGNSRFADFFFIITGYHLAHVAAGVIALLMYRSDTRPGTTSALAWYWHFVDAIWLVIFLVLY